MFALLSLVWVSHFEQVNSTHIEENSREMLTFCNNSKLLIHKFWSLFLHQKAFKIAISIGTIGDFNFFFPNVIIGYYTRVLYKCGRGLSSLNSRDCKTFAFKVKKKNSSTPLSITFLAFNHLKFNFYTLHFKFVIFYIEKLNS